VEDRRLRSYPLFLIPIVPFSFGAYARQILCFFFFAFFFLGFSVAPGLPFIHNRSFLEIVPIQVSTKRPPFLEDIEWTEFPPSGPLVSGGGPPSRAVFLFTSSRVFSLRANIVFDFPQYLERPLPSRVQAR